MIVISGSKGGGAKEVRPVQFLNFMQFSGKMAKIVGLGLAHPSGKSWIRH